MKFVKFMLAVAMLGAFSGAAAAQTGGMIKKTAKTVGTSTAKTETFQVLGNCGMCQTIIEKAARGAGAQQAAWDADTRKITVTFDPTKASTDGIQKAIAEAGYDNAGYKAPDAVYAKLHGCCQYDRSGAPSTANSCEVPAAEATTPAATGTVETQTFKVLGDCGMCEKTILSAAKEAGATEASWDMDTHVMVVKFPAGATTVAKIQQAIAEKGYDTPSMKASEATYKALPSCCQYDRSARLD